MFDPTTKTGELAINASKGVLRLVGGKISKNGPIVITTPANTVGIRGGITILDVKANQTDSVFVFGKDMTVRAAGKTQIATRPGSMIVTNLGGPPGLPTILAQGALNAQLAALEGGRRGSQSSSGGSGGGGRNPDQVAQSSGLSGVNSSQSVRIVAPGVPDNFGSGPGPRNRNPNDTIVTALSDANQSTQTNTSKQTQPQPQTQTQDFSLPDHDKFDLGLFDFRGLGLDRNGRLATISELGNSQSAEGDRDLQRTGPGVREQQLQQPGRRHLPERLELRQSQRRRHRKARWLDLRRRDDAQRQPHRQRAVLLIQRSRSSRPAVRQAAT